MSYQALTWVTDVCRTKTCEDLSSSDRFILMALANYTNEEHGTTVVSRSTIAAITGLSDDTIGRALRRMEAGRLIARIPRVKFNGGVTSSTTVLLRDDEAVRLAVSLGWKPSREEGEGEGEPDGGTDEALTPPAPCGEGVKSGDEKSRTYDPPLPHHAGDPPRTMRVAPPHHAGAYVIQETNTNPLSPPKRGERRALPPGQHDPDPDGADAFLARWPQKTISDAPEPVRRAWARLTLEERHDALKHLDAYADALRKAGFAKWPSAKTYLSDKRWASLDLMRQGRRDGTAQVPRVFVRAGTPAFEAWERHLRDTGRITGRLFTTWSEADKAHGSWKASLFPPKQEVAV